MTATQNKFASYEHLHESLVPSEIDVGDYRAQNRCGAAEARGVLYRKAVEKLLSSGELLTHQDLHWVLRFMFDKGML